MSALLKTTFILTGPLAGKTVKLGSLPFPFVGGKLTIQATPKDLGLYAQFLERNWQALPENDPRLETTNGQCDIPEDEEESVPSEVQPNRAGAPTRGTAEDGSGLVETGDRLGWTGGDRSEEIVDQKLREAVLKLDPTNETHWTVHGKPALDVVAKFLGSSNVTRRQVDAAAGDIRKPAVIG